MSLLKGGDDNDDALFVEVEELPGLHSLLDDAGFHRGSYVCFRPPESIDVIRFIDLPGEFGAEYDDDKLSDVDLVFSKETCLFIPCLSSRMKEVLLADIDRGAVDSEDDDDNVLE